MDQVGYCSDPSHSQWHPPYLRDIKADLQPDFHVDMADLELFAGCFAGPAAPGTLTPLCAEADFDGDGDVDLADFAGFQRCFSGPDTPASPSCMD